MRQNLVPERYSKAEGANCNTRVDVRNNYMMIASHKKSYNRNVKNYQLVVTVVMKNWEPLVSGPALAMERRPGPVCFSLKFSSANLVP